MADRLRALGWRLLAWLIVPDPDERYSLLDQRDGHPGRGGRRG